MKVSNGSFYGLSIIGQTALEQLKEFVQFYIGEPDSVFRDSGSDFLWLTEYL
jgi:hypothetical protein